MGAFEYLPLFLDRIRAIADDSFDHRAADQLRSLASQIEQKLSFRPISLKKQSDAKDVNKDV
jgi:hypothetical protein